jgi:hypothetical protein
MLNYTKYTQKIAYYEHKLNKYNKKLNEYNDQQNMIGGDETYVGRNQYICTAKQTSSGEVKQINTGQTTVIIGEHRDDYVREKCVVKLFDDPIPCNNELKKFNNIDKHMPSSVKEYVVGIRDNRCDGDVENPFLILKYAGQFSLKEMIYKNNWMLYKHDHDIANNALFRRTIFHVLLNRLYQIHKTHIMYDIKPDNIILNTTTNNARVCIDPIYIDAETIEPIDNCKIVNVETTSRFYTPSALATRAMNIPHNDVVLITKLNDIFAIVSSFVSDVQDMSPYSNRYVTILGFANGIVGADDKGNFIMHHKFNDALMQLIELDPFFAYIYDKYQTMLLIFNNVFKSSDNGKTYKYVSGYVNDSIIDDLYDNTGNCDAVEMDISIFNAEFIKKYKKDISSQLKKDSCNVL